MNERAGDKPPWQHLDGRHRPRPALHAVLPGAPGTAPTLAGAAGAAREELYGRSLSPASPAAVPAFSSSQYWTSMPGDEKVL